ncbi:MAG: hypothetical protein AAF492_28700, partial [Verrucomicrobiota bacterium]
RVFLLRVRGQETDYVGQYWNDRVYRSLQILSSDCAAEAEQVARELESLIRFPLDEYMPEKEDPLRYDEFIRAIKIMEQLNLPTIESDVPTLAAGGELRNERLTGVIDELRSLRTGLDPEWWAKTLAMKDALYSKTGPMRGTIKMMSYTEQLDEDFLTTMANWNWTVVSVEDPGNPGREEKFKTFQLNPVTMMKFRYPGQPLVFRFYKYFSDQVENRTLAFDGPWGILKLLKEHEGRRDPKSPKTWKVQLRVKSDEGREYGLWLAIEFDREIPPLEDWPVDRVK